CPRHGPLLQRRSRERRAPARADPRPRSSRSRPDRPAADGGRPCAAGAAARPARRGRSRHSRGGRARRRGGAGCTGPRLALPAPPGGAAGPARPRPTKPLTTNPDLSQRLEIQGQDELARLARSFNATLDALERSAEAQRHLVADASHELRTPIASLRANVQVLQDADLLPEADRESLRADIIAELDELTALVGDVVELARGSKPSDVVDDVRIDQIVRALVDRAERRAGDGVTFRVSLQPTVVSGEPERI